MYTSYIGKKFLRLWNKRQGNHKSAEEFFNETFFNIFFNHESHLMHVGNSPFFQKPRAPDVDKHGSKSAAQLANLKSAIQNDPPNMSIFVGFAAKDVGGTTSGQLTTLDFNIYQEELYASWIGQALSIGMRGGYLMLINEDEVLWTLFKGWQLYRDYLTQTPNLKDKQIETWNGQWLNHSFSGDFDPDDPFYEFNIYPETVLSKLAIPTIKWTKIIFVLSKKFSVSFLTAYAYNLSQMNTTLGFVNIYLPEVRSFLEIKDVLFLHSEKYKLTEKELKQLNPFFTFKSACTIGTIGLKVLEPDNLRMYMPRGSVPYAQGKEYKFTNEQSIYNYQIFKIWIIAMLKKTELLELAAKVAATLNSLEQKEERAKKVLSTLSKEVREAKTLKLFLDNITKVMNELPDTELNFRDLVKEVLELPADQFPLFITLIRFEYAYQLKNN